MSDTPPQRLSAPPEKRDHRPIREVERLGDLLTNEEFKRKLAAAVPGTISVSRVLSTLAGSIRKSPDLMRCNVLDVAGKILMVANTGLELDSALQQAHLIPYRENRWNPATRRREPVFVAQVVFGYRGLLDLSYRSGQVGAIRAEVVWHDEVTAGMFAHEYGTSQFLKHVKLGRDHKTDAISQANGTAEFPAWAYAYAQLTEGRGTAFEVLPWAAVRKIRDNSPAYRSALYFMEEAKKEGKNIPAGWMKAPWVEHVAAMANKTAFRQLSNWLPRSVEFAAALALDEASDSHTLDLGPIVDLDTSAYAEAAVDAAEASGDSGATFGVRAPDEDAGRPAGEASSPGQTPPVVTRPPASQTAQRKAPAKKAAAPVQNEPPEDRWPPETEPWSSNQSEPVAAAAKPAPDETREPPPTQPASVVAAPAPEGSATPSGADFEAFVLDENGDPLFDEPETDPVTFAAKLSARHEKSMADETLLQQNADGIQDARAASPRAAAMLDLLTLPESPDETANAAELGIIVVPLQFDRGKPLVKPYLDAFKAEALTLMESTFLDFIELNRGEMAKAPVSTASLCLKALVERSRAIGVPVPPDLGPSLLQRPQPAKEPITTQTTEDPDWSAARNRIAEMKACASKHDLEAMARGIVMKGFGDRLKREGKAEIIAQLEDAYSAKLATFG